MWNGKNTLYYGDNIDIMRQYLPDESIDLVYADPPFNSQRGYNILFRDERGQEAESQIRAFDDTWHWDYHAASLYAYLRRESTLLLSKTIEALYDILGESQMLAYLVMMTGRLIEIHRVLKPTGSFYLHCDPTASHYIKILLDATFGTENFRNEIIWKRNTAHNDASRWGSIHDTILFYSKTDRFTWNPVYISYDEKHLARFKKSDSDGRRWTDGDLSAKGLSGGGYTYEYKGVKSLWRVPVETMERLDIENRLYFTSKGGIRIKRYLDELSGTPVQDVITDIFPINSQASERLGYPTQKPLVLLERIIKASSDEGQVVLDPFCGCGTAIAAAGSHNRRWIGIDITHLAVSLMRYRIRDMFPKTEFDVVGVPIDIGGAYQLFSDDPYQFQWWALGLIGARPFGSTTPKAKTGKKGKDRGVDGVIRFEDDITAKGKFIIVQVKGGENIRSSDVRDLRGTVEREEAPMGIFITLTKPTEEMRREAIAAGFYYSKGWNRQFPKLQIVTVEDIISGKAKLNIPPQHGTFKQTVRANVLAEQYELNILD